jgi:hypothetical protein
MAAPLLRYCSDAGTTRVDVDTGRRAPKCIGENRHASPGFIPSRSRLNLLFGAAAGRRNAIPTWNYSYCLAASTAPAR